MNRRSFVKSAYIAGLSLGIPSSSTRVAQGTSSTANPRIESAPSSDSPESILLKDYRPQSLYKIPFTDIAKAKFPAIDMHSHPWVETPEQVAEWVKNMEAVGVEKTIILTMTAGAKFDNTYRLYSKYPDRFEVWCGLDLAGYDKAGFGVAAIKELERCHRLGARGVGELHDKGRGLASGESKTVGMHPDDARMDFIFEKCGELGMPVSLHVGDPIWMYQKMDKTNDGLMNAYEWRLDNQPGIAGLSEMVDILERTTQRHPHTTFIACHFANLDYDLGRLAGVLDRNPNLYADISARYAETAPIPRFAAQFYARCADRLLYGTDMGFDVPMYRVTFRILETVDEHFYEIDQFNYHWALNGLGLSDSILKRVYRENAVRLMASRGSV